MDKTIVVAIEDKYAHKIYGKTLKKTKRFMAHDESNRCELGDTVLITETRPISKHKRWEVSNILNTYSAK